MSTPSFANYSGINRLPQDLPIFAADDYLSQYNGSACDTGWAILIADVVTAGGGVIQFGPYTYRLDNTWIMTYAGTPPRQVPIVIQGSGMDATGGVGSAPAAGTIFDLRYDAAGANVAKWDMRGVGTFAVRDCNFICGGTATNGTPFLKTTNTVLFVRNCYFRGTTAGASANQDAIVLGGTTTNFGTSAADDGFQGYGTVVEGNYFAQIRRGVYGRTFCNGVVVQNNTWWSNCGGTAAIEFDGMDDSNSGNVVSGNLIEVANYTYAIKLTDTAINNTFVGNNFFDYDGSMTSYYYFGAGSSYNTVIDGYHSDNGTWATAVDTATLASCTRITSHQSQTTNFGQPVRFTTAELGSQITCQNTASVSVYTPQTLNSAGDVFDGYTTYAVGTGFGHVVWRFTPSGGSVETLMDLFRVSSTQARLDVGGTGGGRVGCTTGDCYFVCTTNGTAWIGDPSDLSNRLARITAGVMTIPQLTTRSYRPTYGTTVAVDPAQGEHIRIEVTNGVAFTISAPSAATAGQRIIIEINNRSGGAMGTITWDTTYKMSGWVNPADTNTRTVMFVYDSFRARWMQVGSISPDLAP